MKSRKWLILLLVIVTMMSLATYTGVTRSVFIDDELSTDDALGIRWGLFTLNDGFEGTPWDDYWNENGTTTWIQDTADPNTGTYNAYSDEFNQGYLTTDEIEASTTDNISVSFWFKLSGVEPGHCLVQTYNGTAYNTWYDLTNYPTYSSNTWCQFNEVRTDSQYLIAGFRLRFDTSSLVDDNGEANIDDVIITTDTIPPAAPTGLVATAAPGDTEVSLDWADNTESDLWGYNVYRSESMGGPYSQINGSLVAASEYTDSTVTELVTYYYVVTAVDFGNNESGDSNEDSATPDWAPLAPTGLVATAAPGDTEVSLDWNDNGESDLDGYNVYRSTDSGGSPTSYTKINGSLVAASEYTDSGVTELVTYYYVVKAVDLVANESGYSNEDSATPDWAPAAPTGLDATAGDLQVSLDWNDNGESDLDGYNVHRSTDSGGSPTPYTKINASLVSTNSYTDNTVTSGVLYYYVVTAVDLIANESGYSNEDSATPFDTAPLAPTGLVATAAPGDTEVSLDWNDNTESDLDGYNVYRSTDSGGSPTPYSQINGSLVAASEYTDSTVTELVTYYYVVKAVDFGSNESGYSNEGSATPDWAPLAPTGLVATATPGDTEVSLDWNDNSEGDIAGYDVYRSTDSGGSPTPYTKINGSLVAASEYTDSGVTELVTYYYVVKAVDLVANESGYSNEDSTTPDWAPAAPTGLDATAGDMQVSLGWNDNGESDLDGYNVHRSTDSGGSPTPYTKINSSLVSTNSYTDNTVTSGVLYYYVVTAVDLIANESGYSNEDSATPFDADPAAPTGLVATAAPGDTEVSLNWNDNGESDLDGYNVHRSESMGGPYSQINGALVAASGYTDNTVTNGVTYYYVVTAVDWADPVACESGYSNEDSARPVGPPQTLLDDGFEGTPWDANWDGNGTTTWFQDSTAPHIDSYNARSDKNNLGFHTSDDLDTFAAENITVTFWFKLSGLDPGDIVVETYNGSTWTTWYDLESYSTYVEDTWCQFSEVITDSQYFITNFRLRFDTSPISGGNEADIDDVLIAINQ